MSQLTLTPEEDAIVADALRAKAAQYAAMYGSADAAVAALIAKVEGQLPAPVVVVPVVETPPDLVEPTEAEIEAHFAEEAVEETSTRKKKAK